MGDFSVAWLRQREPVDRRSRNVAVAAALRSAFARVPTIRVVDLGCGTGANLRATAPLLGQEQDWTLLDNDPGLLESARAVLGAWADDTEQVGDGMRLLKDGTTIRVRFRQCDIAADPAAATQGADLLTASAFFDLVSPAFIDALVAAVVDRRAAFHTVLTYDGAQTWSPAGRRDEPVRQAFNRHQGADKGFGPAAGPEAPALLRRAFGAAGYRTVVGESPWVLGAGDGALMAQLADGVAAAVAETGCLTAEAIAAWRAAERSGVRIGHQDLLALPDGSGRRST